MALIKTSSLITSIRGKVAGSVFQKSNAGTILRGNSTPVNRNTNLQNKTRHKTFFVLQEWIKLTDAQRLTWLNYTQYNPVVQKRTKGLFITGQQAFVKFNSYRLEYDLPILSTPIFNKCALDPIELTLSTTGAVLSIVADRALVSANEFIILFLTIVFRSSVNNPGSKYKIINFVTTSTDTFDITSEYVSLFGTVPQNSDTIFMKYTNASKLSGLPFPFKSEKVSL